MSIVLRLRAFPFTEAVERLHRRARAGVRRRAEPRRASCARMIVNELRDRPGTSWCRSCTSTARPSRPASSAEIADRLRVRRRAAQAIATRSQQGRIDDLSRQTRSFTTQPCRRTRSATPAETTKARSRRSAPAAVMTRSRRRSSRPAGSWTSSRIAWPSCSGIGCSSKTPDYFLGNFARLQLGPRPHAVGADRRQPGQPRPDLPRCLRRRRLAPRSASASSPTRCDAA
jgi:hypothetical protein